MTLNAKQQAQFNKLCERIGNGESLRAACDGKRGSVKGTTTFYDMLEKETGDKPLTAQYARARDRQAEGFASGIVEISDDQSLDPNSRRVMVDARKWIAARILPKQYGDKLDVKLAGNLVIGIKRNERLDDD